ITDKGLSFCRRSIRRMTGPLPASWDYRISLGNSQRPTLQRDEPVNTRFTVTSETEFPRVDIVVSYAGQDGVMIDAAVANGARGLVSMGTGAGKPTPKEAEALRRAIARGILVVQSTRVRGGRVLVRDVPPN